MSLKSQELFQQAKAIILIVAGSALESGATYIAGAQGSMEEHQHEIVQGQQQQHHDTVHGSQVTGITDNAPNTSQPSQKPTDTQVSGSVSTVPTPQAQAPAPVQPVVKVNEQQVVYQVSQRPPLSPDLQPEYLSKRGQPEIIAPEQVALQIDSLQHQVADLQRKVQEQERQAAKDANEHRIKLIEYVRKTQRLNQIIIKYGQSDEPSDGDIESEARDIRSAMNNLVLYNFKGQNITVDYKRATQLTDMDKPYYQKAKDMKQDPLSFYMGLRGRSAQIKRALMIGKLFSILNVEIFRSKWFGMDKQASWKMEEGLGEFEKVITRKGDKEEVEEWRKRTVALARGLKIRPVGRAHDVAFIMFDLLTCATLAGPLGNTDEARARLFDALKDLCENALNLTLRFRATRTKYSFQTLEVTSVLDRYATNEFDVMGVNGDLSEDPLNPKKARVFCNLWGALVKTKEITATEEEKRVVLAPAHIYVYEEPQQ